MGNVLLFVPNGTIVAAVMNAPRTMHDSQISEWGGLYQELEDVYDLTGSSIVVDSAFHRSRYKFLIKSAQDETHTEGPEEVNQIRQATSMRQALEWVMRTF